MLEQDFQILRAYLWIDSPRSGTSPARLSLARVEARLVIMDKALRNIGKDACYDGNGILTDHRAVALTALGEE